MKLITAASVIATATAFAPVHNTGFSSVTLRSTAEPPERTAPDAGFTPEWEDRQGLSPEEFIKSDMSKPDLSGMWECPLTRWESEGCVQCL